MRLMYRILPYILLASMILFSCSEDKVEPVKDTPAEALETQPDQISTDVKITFVDSSVVKARLKANKARVFTKLQKTYLDGDMVVEFLSQYTGERVSILTADSAEIDDKTKDMTARGNVIVFSDSTFTKLETTTLNWDNGTRLFHSKEYVVITSPTETTRGYGFESDQNLKNYKIFKVSGEIK